MRYFISHSGKNQGPFSFQEIEAKFHAGEFNQNDNVYVGETAEWVPILQFMLSHRPQQTWVHEEVIVPVLVSIPEEPIKPKPSASIKRVDVTATAEVNVLPPKSTRLQIQVIGEARVGEDLEIVVNALSEAGAPDLEFNQQVALSCDRPLQGLIPLQFHQGQARLTVKCLTQGPHRFGLNLLPEIQERPDLRGPLSH